MPNLTVIQAWKDPDYRRGLTAEQRNQLPAHPAGTIEFQDHGLEEAIGLLSKSMCRKCGSTAP
jgi:mersacidin/lichenicidin family type 2 lantibiotic